MRNTSLLRLPAVSAQAIKSILGSALMRAYVFITAGYYTLFFLSPLAALFDAIGGSLPCPRQRLCLWTPLKGCEPFRIPD